MQDMMERKANNVAAANGNVLKYWSKRSVFSFQCLVYPPACVGVGAAAACWMQSIIYTFTNFL